MKLCKWPKKIVTETLFKEVEEEFDWKAKYTPTYVLEDELILFMISYFNLDHL